ncbi:alpha amylase catalytic subunit [Arthrobacter crystallopoietes BAB-32]|uniref:Alpha-amylase n=1 Tax=Arthrobacter crystallopoietes BAB-32 TaxID=1246476 RepID=N1UZK2_9MICC|nr:alpha-amylase family protein [Arthrobacter crystallopoietes]EMY34500.1 alpha amylase catalytic subunit [Arthrobacter crystallopoietes BAB-32]
MRIADTSDLWWKNALIYCVDIETFFDSDGDGTGDIPGLAERVDYLVELGVTCLWLMPFYPTPDRDDGYDIIDFYGVDHRLGSAGDLVELIRTAKSRGLRVIADLVVNHTSDRHPWFQAARANTDNEFRDYYIWREDEPPDTSDLVVFHSEEKGIWTQDEPTGHWYLHRFYKHQPDLNLSNPKVRDEIAKVIGFWLQLGLDGFRVDAVPQLVTVGLQDEIESSEGFTAPHDFLRSLRRFMNRRNGQAVLLGEVNLPYKDQLKLFGDRDSTELTLIFDFVAMQNMYLSLARADAGPLANALKNRPEIPPEAQWATFVRNHDELTLDQLSESERQEVFAAFGPRKNMQVYGRGLKRRLPPMLQGDLDRTKMVYSLLFSLPGTPALYYGEEIGMGEDLGADRRMAVRTPMQWTSGANGGFSNAAPDKLASAVVGGDYGPNQVNVADAKQDPDSLLNFITMLARRYRECPELAWGSFSLLDQPRREVLAHRCHWEGSSIIAVHNFGPDNAKVPLTFKDAGPQARLQDLLGADHLELDNDGGVQLELSGYGFRWLRLLSRGEETHKLPQVMTTVAAAGEE